MKITQVRAIVKEINEDVVITKLHAVCGGVVYEASIYGVTIYTFTMKQGKDITQVAWAELCEAIEGHQVANPNDVVIEQGDNMDNYEGLTKREVQEANDFEMRSFNIEDASDEIFRHCEELGVNDGIVIRHIQGRHAEDTLQRYAVIFKGYTVTTFILSSIQPGDEHTTNGTIINRVKWDIASFMSDYYNPDQHFNGDDYE